ncbi:hypothetical protein niasHT_012945 [Heterodera trifolii]|uniref:RING-type domain-containing protein n=1 Tax=Heterodera trifolii TaxID=157864 RepID=A0ABD2L7Y8_9BILA
MHPIGRRRRQRRRKRTNAPAPAPIDFYDEGPSKLTQFLCFYVAPLCIILIVIFLHCACHCTQTRQHHQQHQQQQQQQHQQQQHQQHQQQQQQQQQPGANNVEMLPRVGAAAAAEVFLNNLEQIINIEVIRQHQQQPQGAQQQQQQPQGAQQQQQRQQQQIPALVAAYRAMPLTLFMANDQQDNECAICLGTIYQGSFVRPLPCKHIFHNNCIEKWLVGSHKTCPLCRDEMATQNGPEQHNNGTANGPN